MLFVQAGVRIIRNPSSFFAEFHSKSPDNKTGYQNPQVDQLLEKALQFVEEKERNTVYMEANKNFATRASGITYFSASYPRLANNIWVLNRTMTVV